MIVSTLRVNKHHPDAAREWRDLCAMHSRIVDATTGMPPDRHRVLWAQPHDGVLVIRAPEPVTVARLPRGWATQITHCPWTPPPVGPVRAVAVVNPTRSRRVYDRPTRPEGCRAVRKPIVDRDEQSTWIADLFADAVHDLAVTVVDERVRKGRHKSGHVIIVRLLTVQLSGQVADAGQVAALAEAGVGAAKAYGGGLSLWQPC